MTEDLLNLFLLSQIKVSDSGSAPDFNAIIFSSLVLAD